MEETIMASKEWIGVDLDGCLAVYDTWRGELHIGEPIMPMVNRVKNWLSHGYTVKIFTARAHEASPRIIETIQDWCEQHIGQRLEVTNVKDYNMRILFDDRAVQVEQNTGELIGYTKGHEERIQSTNE
jgi:hypothetical protein